ncbi:MAG: ABC transporter permease [Chlamydiales bacterium]|nr:hypothetical protein [Chlamydiales bacterium]NCF71815.1 ABC transporter permease [Chlamydiales bacterium]
MFNFLLQVLEQSLLFFPLVLALYISFSTLKIPDLSIEGSFVTGAACFASLVSYGQNCLISIAVALLAGALIGLIVALIQKENKVSPLITGVLMIFILSSVNLFIMGRPNLSLLNTETPLSMLQNYLPNYSENNVSLIFISGQLVFLLLTSLLLLNSKVGLLFRAFGNNAPLLNRLGKKPELIRSLGLACSNLVAAYCGVLFTQINAYADINMGFGFALIGIAALILGMQLKHFIFNNEKKSILLDLLMAFSGIFIYFFFVQLFLRFNFNPNTLKLFVGISLVVFLLSTKDNKQMELAI